MELVAIVIGTIVLGLAAVDELQRQWDQRQLDEDLHEQSEVHSTPVMNFAEVADCDDPVKEGLHRDRSASPLALSPMRPLGSVISQPKARLRNVKVH
jgi:hypothetical protein